MNYHMHGMAFDAQRAAFPPGAAATLCDFFEFTQFPCNREKNELVRRTVTLLSPSAHALPLRGSLRAAFAGVLADAGEHVVH